MSKLADSRYADAQGGGGVQDPASKCTIFPSMVNFLANQLLPWNLFAPGAAAQAFVNCDSTTLKPNGPVSSYTMPRTSSPPPTLQSFSNKPGNLPDSGYETGRGAPTESTSASQIGLAAGAFQRFENQSEKQQWDLSIESGWTGVAEFFKGPNQKSPSSSQSRGYGMQDNLCPKPPYGPFPIPPCEADVLPGFTTQPNGASPAAYLMQESNTGDKIVVDIDGRPISFLKAQKESYFGELPFPPPVMYTHQGKCLNADCGSHDSGSSHEEEHTHTITYSHPDIGTQQPPVNPIQGVRGVPQYSTDIIPSYDMGYYVNVLCLPEKPQDIIVYFNSLCSALALSVEKWEWIAENFIESSTLLDALDESIFQMNDFISPYRLRDANGEPVFWFLPEDPGDNGRMPTITTLKEWHEEIQRGRRHLRRLNSLAYSHVLNKGKVHVVWRKMVDYCDDWANMLFSACDEEGWEVTSENADAIKQWYFFNREMRRIVMTIENDLIMIARLENLVKVLGGSVFKAEAKLDIIMERFY
ncbi:hypothetical protein TWF696_007918 [Orbilia brochopaga]|uniref:Uncharacterized protein n=1 Tax=Orbilia brochopaga TaxID=3140254 RepID=A0AAV9ULI2_9PEZI